MALDEPILDDLRFQRDLVDEARKRIVRYSPEWTDYNVSDPGITLLELFAWMTELTTYRLNRVPEKNYIRFLDLLGLQLLPASPARCELTFRLSTPLPIEPDNPITAIVPEGIEVASLPTAQGDEVIFTTDTRLEIAGPKLTQLRRADEVTKNYVPRLGIEPFYAFDRARPQPGDTFYIGFDEHQPIGGYILRLSFEADETQAPGIRRDDPPWVWECSIGNGQWQEIAPSTRRDERDTTGGLNNAYGEIVFYLPLEARVDQVHGRSAFWLRCRIEQRRPEHQGMFAQAPRVRALAAHSLGGTVRATHATIITLEELGESTGDPGQSFKLNYSPVLTLRQGETVEVEEIVDGETVFVAWDRVDDFSLSSAHDRHFKIDYSTGEIMFGPTIRQPNGDLKQYGRLPESGRMMRITKYRTGGGVAGNLPPQKLQVMRSAVPYIDSVTNYRRAEGGRDQETVEEAKMRARKEIRAQHRAVTNDDYEYLAKATTRGVARAKCVSPSEGSNLPPGTVDLLVVPAVFDSIRVGDLSRLALTTALGSQVEAGLDERRLLTATLRVREPGYIGVKVFADIVPSPYSNHELVKARVLETLTQFITPLSLSKSPVLATDDQSEELGGEQVSFEAPKVTLPNDLVTENWEGWEFGRDLYLAELYALIQQVPGVRHVRDVRVNTRPVVPVREGPQPDGTEARVPQLTAVVGRLLPVPDDHLLCSLGHTVTVVEI